MPRLFCFKTAFVPPTALVPVPPSFPSIPLIPNPLRHTRVHTYSPFMPVHMNAPSTAPRQRPRPAANASYARVNAIQNLHPGLQDIVKNCPALDVIFDHDNPRSSTHRRGRGRDKEHVARPPNAFMVYRSYVWYTKQLENKDEKNLSCVSRLAARSWGVMSEQARAPFKQVADIAKREHAERNPDYKYAPSSRAPKKPSKTKGKARVKQAAATTKGGLKATPSSKEARPVPAGGPGAVHVDAPVASSHSTPSSSESSSSPSTPPAPNLLQEIPGMRSPSLELGYPWDCDLPGYPPKPRFRPLGASFFPSPSVSILNLDDPVLDGVPDVGPASITLSCRTLTPRQKYKEAESYHNVLPHPLTDDEDIPFDDTNPHPPCTEGIDYSSFISGDPEVKFGSPTPDACDIDTQSTIGGCFSPGPSTTSTLEVEHSLALALSPLPDWDFFDMPTIGSDRIVDECNIYGPNDGGFFDTVVTCGAY
ncbi:hypothetical protein F5148DRAFT_1184103 [Russula earlei]|uniref:Uncharacterized protein n=1 Tax=Russula earlei TaxID=71964 RepID=A0ACC0UDZ0_9AGAM|nr:hypothetical protein F5148DRAFT_1184103 [Russula earlei]